MELQGQINANTANYKYFEDLLALTERLAEELKSNISSYYTIQQYRSFLIKLIGDYEAEELKDDLASYIKKIDNRISVSVPISQTPKITSIAKGTVKKSAIVFVVALMISVFASFLLEGLKKIQVQAS